MIKLKFLVEVLESKDPHRQTKLAMKELEEGFKEFLKKMEVNYRTVRIVAHTADQ